MEYKEYYGTGTKNIAFGKESGLILVTVKNGTISLVLIL